MMEKVRLESVHFKELKGLHDVTITFEKPLTAIMGVNGSGKTTVIHALACLFKPDEEGKGEDHRFPEFFIPNTDSLWTGSELVSMFSNVDKTNNKLTSTRKYSKTFDRWNPHYIDRPKRNVYYIGIDTCLPEIEKENATSRISYTSAALGDRVSQKIIKAAAYILNKSYISLTDNTYRGKRHLTGVTLDTGLKYSSLSMGTGEQRTIKILEKVYSAEAYSLVLIDEIDLLLHISALQRLIKELSKIAIDKNLQIVFTTHSLAMDRLSDYVGIQYIENVVQSSGAIKSMVYSKISSDLIFSLTGYSTRPLKIYVEDEFAKAVIKTQLRRIGMSAKAEVIKYGAIENSFTLAAGLILQDKDITNCLIVLDGDKYNSLEDKLTQIKKALSGTEADIEDKWNRAASIITQFQLPLNTAPERFFRNLLVINGNPKSELVKTALEINAVRDSHEWVEAIRVKLGDSEESVVKDIVAEISSCDEWTRYIKSVAQWLEARIYV